MGGTVKLLWFGYIRFKKEGRKNRRKEGGRDRKVRERKGGRNRREEGERGRKEGRKEKTTTFGKNLYTRRFKSLSSWKRYS